MLKDLNLKINIINCIGFVIIDDFFFSNEKKEQIITNENVRCSHVSQSIQYI